MLHAPLAGLEDAASHKLAAELQKAHDDAQNAGPPLLSRDSTGLKKRRPSAASLKDGAWYRAFLTSHAVRESARAITYCDVVSLDVQDLSQLLARDYLIRTEEKQESKESAKKNLSGIGQRINFMNKLRRITQEVDTAKQPAAVVDNAPPAAAIPSGSASQFAGLRAVAVQAAARADVDRTVFV